MSSLEAKTILKLGIRTSPLSATNQTRMITRATFFNVSLMGDLLRTHETDEARLFSDFFSPPPGALSGRQHQAEAGEGEPAAGLRRPEVSGQRELPKERHAQREEQHSAAERDAATATTDLKVGHDGGCSFLKSRP